MWIKYYALGMAFLIFLLVISTIVQLLNFTEYRYHDLTWILAEVIRSIGIILPAYYIARIYNMDSGFRYGAILGALGGGVAYLFDKLFLNLVFGDNEIFILYTIFYDYIFLGALAGSLGELRRTKSNK